MFCKAKSNLPKKNPTYKSIRICAQVEEELFIRHNAAIIRHARPSRSNPSLPSPAKPSTPPEDDVQFDFVQQDPLTGTDSESGPSSETGLPPLNPTSPEDSSQPKTFSSDSQQGRSNNGDSSTESGGTTGAPVKILQNQNTRIIDRVKHETARIIMDTHIGAGLRFPTQREAFTLAGEVIVVVTILMLLRAGVSKTLRWIHNRVNKTRGIRPLPPYETSVLECMQRPLEFVCLLTVGTFLAEAVTRPLAATGFLKHVRNLRELGIIIGATWFILRWIDRIRSRFATDMRMDKAQLDATARFATVATFVVSLLISLDTIGINVQTVLAFGGIGGVAIGFAGREIISNFFGGLMIYVTRPFMVGEWVRCIEQEHLNGTVEDIGWYLTCLRSWDKRPLYIPNSRFSTLIVENGSRMDNRRIVHTLHLRLEDIPVAPTIVSKMEAYLNNHPALDPKQHRLVYIDSFDDYSVQIWFSCYTKSVFLYDFKEAQQEILLRFHDIIRNEGARLANRNTRDVRPGADTDRYGPFGKFASYGPKAEPATIHRETWEHISEGNGTTEGLNAMYQKSGSTPADVLASGKGMYAKPDKKANRNTVDAAEDNHAPLSSSSSVAAVAAAAAAAAATAALAKRRAVSAETGSNGGPVASSVTSSTADNGARTGETGKDAGNRSAVDGDGKKVPAGSGAVPGTQMQSSESQGQMMISKAPPARGSPATNPGSDSKTVEDSNGKAGSKDSQGKGDGSEAQVDAKVGTAGAGQMKISKAPVSRNATATSSSSATNASGNGNQVSGRNGAVPQTPMASGATAASAMPTAFESRSATLSGPNGSSVDASSTTSVPPSSSASTQSPTAAGTKRPAPPASESGEGKKAEQTQSRKSSTKGDKSLASASAEGKASSAPGCMRISGAPPRQANSGANDCGSGASGNIGTTTGGCDTNVNPGGNDNRNVDFGNKGNGSPPSLSSVEGDSEVVKETMDIKNKSTGES